MFNADLARLAIKEIEANPQEWSQEVWRCETGYCFAGFVALAAGAQWVNPTLNEDEDDDDDNNVITPDGRILSSSDYAREVLGVGAAESAELFWGGNTISSLKYQVGQLAKRHG
jgi:hypothetical protein